jgi:hypothetical protein
MHKKAFFALAILGCLATAAQAVTTVTAGNYFFAPNTVNNEVKITGTNDANDQTAGMNFVIQIGDGVTAGQPLLTFVDLIAGTIFNSNNTGQFNTLPSQAPTPNPFSGNLTNPGIVYTGSVTTSSGTVGTAGLLGTLKFSTVGVAPGVYQLRLNKTAFPPVAFNFAPTAATRVDGTITVTPEPSAIVMGLIAATGLGAVMYRRRRARKAA